MGRYLDESQCIPNYNIFSSKYSKQNAILCTILSELVKDESGMLKKSPKQSQINLVSSKQTRIDLTILDDSE